MPPARGTKATGKRLHLVEMARGLAALSVVLYHAERLMAPPQYSGKLGFDGLFHLGFLGVDFFFLLSGFLILHVHYGDIGRPGRAPRYLWRRVVRIFPVYWLMLLVEAIARWAFKPQELGRGGEWLAQALIATPFDKLWIGPAWSLQFELLFYGVFVLLILSRRLGLLALLAWFGGVVLFTLWPPAGSAITGWWLRNVLLEGYCLYFALGMVIALALRRGAAMLLGCVALYGLVAIVLLSTHHGGIALDDSLLRYAFVGTAFGAILGLLVLLDQKSPRIPQPLLWLGGASYSLYLSHVFIISHGYALLARFGLYRRLSDLLIFALAVALALIGAAILHGWFERPILKGLRRLVR